MSIFQIMNLLDDPENTFSSEDISKITFWILRVAMEIILRILHKEVLRLSLLITAKK